MAVTLWSIWHIKNQLIFEGKTANPHDTLMTCNALINRYSSVFCKEEARHQRVYSAQPVEPKRVRDWQIIIIIAGHNQGHDRICLYSISPFFFFKGKTYVAS